MLKQIFATLLVCSSIVHGETSAEFLKKAVSFAREGKYSEAATTASKAIEADDKNWEAYFVRAQLYSRMGQHAKSIEDLNRLIEKDSQKANLYNLRGMEYFRAGDMTKSIADFDTFIKLSPGEEAHHWQRGISYYYAGKYVEGKKQFELHQTVNANDVENAVWHFICSAKVDGFEKAQSKIIPISGDRRVPMAQVQELFAGKGTPEAVMEAAKAGTPPEDERKNRLFYAHLYLGLYFEAKGDAAKAREHIQAAATTYSQGHYMGDVARVHWKKLSKENAK